MSDGHFHFHSAPVSRAKGHSAVAAAAYQSNQDLTHREQRCFAIDLAHRNALGRGIISEALRAQFTEARLFMLDAAMTLAPGGVSNELRTVFALHDEELSSRTQLYLQGEDFTLYDPSDRTRYHIQRVEDQWAVSRVRGLTLSEQATVEKLDRRTWLIHDEGATYRVREYRENIKDTTTGKRKQVAKHLDVYADRLHRFARKGDVVETWVQANHYAPDWIQAIADTPNPSPAQREQLWNWAESKEVARDGRPARSFQMALLRELPYEESRRILRAYIWEQFIRHGLVADVAIHQKQASDGEDNLHCHVLITTRELGEDGEPSTSKNTYWDSKQRLLDWRAAWAAKLNQALEAHGSETRVDHRSYEDQGIDKEPGEHLGPQLWEMEQRGVETAKGDRNRESQHDNRLRALAAAYQLPPSEEDEPLKAEHSDGLMYETTSSRDDGILRAASEQESISGWHPEELHHEMRMRHYLAGRLLSSIHQTAETFHRLRAYGRTVLERAKSLGQSLIDRATLRAAQWESGRDDKGMDR